MAETDEAHGREVEAVRPFRPEDREAVQTILNQGLPPHLQRTAAAWEADDARKSAAEVYIRRVIADPATDTPFAYMNAVDLGTIPGAWPGFCGFSIAVAPGHRRRGLGAALYALAAGFAEAHHLKKMGVTFHLTGRDDPGAAFLTRRGFTEQERYENSHLALAGSVLARPGPPGVSFLSYAQVPDTEENRRRLHALEVRLWRDMPRCGDDPYEDKPFEEFVKAVFDRPEWTPGLLLLAVGGTGEWIGMTRLTPKPKTTVADQGMTGVLPEHRGKGLATALKVRAYAEAEAHGITLITTGNHVDNAPMLAVNRRLGFVPDPPLVLYSRALPEETRRQEGAAP